MSQQWGQAPPGYQYPLQTGVPSFQQQQQQQQILAQQTGYPGLQQPGRPGQFLQAQPTGFPGAQMQLPQQTGFQSFQRPMMTGAPPMGFQNQGGMPPVPPVPPLPNNLSAQGQPNRFLNPSPQPSGFSPGPSPQSYQPTAAPLVAQPTGFMDPRLTMMGSIFIPNASGGFGGGLPQFGGASLQQSIQQHNQEKRGTATQQIPWALSKQERKQYDQIFRSWDTSGSGFLDGQKALEVFGASGLDKNDLAQIWALADPDDRGKLNREEFHVAMGLIYRRLNGNDLPEQLPPELVPPSAKSLDESVDMLRDLLKHDNYARNTNPEASAKGKSRSFYSSNGAQNARKDGAAYKYDDEEEVPVYRSSSRYVDRKAVRSGTESPSADLAEMQRQLENAAKRIDRVTAEQAARTEEDDALDRELEDLRRRVKRVQDDLDYVSRGPRSFEKDEDRRRLERELLNLLHERLPEVQRKIEDRDRRKAREKEEWSSDRDRRNATFGRYGGDKDRDRDDYRRYDYDRRDERDRREEDRGYLRGTYDSDKDKEDRYRDDRSYGRDRDYNRDRNDRDRDYDRDRNDRDRDRERPKTPPTQARSPPPPAPAAPPAAVAAARAPPPAPSPSVSTRNMTPEERQAYIRAEASRRLAERQQRLGLISPSVTPAPDNAVEERLAKEREEAAAKASAAEKEAEQREAARRARLENERGGIPKPASPAPPPAPVAAVSSPAVPSPGPAVPVKKKAPPPPAPRSAMKSPLSSALKKSPAPPPPAPVSVPSRAPPVPVVAPIPPKPVEPEVDPEEETFSARQAALQKAREKRAAELRELEMLEAQERQEQEQLAARRAAMANKSASATPVTSEPPAPPPAPAQSSTNPFHRMQQGGGSAVASPAVTTAGGFNPFSRPTVSSPSQQPATISAPPVAPPTPVPRAPVAPPPPPVQEAPAPAPAPVAPVTQPTAPVYTAPVPAPPSQPSYQKPKPTRRETRDSDDWESIAEKSDDDDSSDDDRTARQKLAAHLFGSVTPSTPRPESRGSNPTRSSTQTPAPITPTTAVSPPESSAPVAPPPPPAPPAPAPMSIPTSIPAAPPAPPAPFAPPPAPPAPAGPISAIPSGPPAGGGDRSALLHSIMGGARLKPTKTVDRSGVLGAGEVLGDTAPPAHIIHPPRAPSPPQQPAPVSNGHAHKESVDWYADLAADVTAPPPALASVTEEELVQAITSVPAIKVDDEAPVPTQNDPLGDIDLGVSHRVRTLYPYDSQREEDLVFGENAVLVAHPSKSGGPWWYGLAVVSGKKGFFPNNYVQVMEEIKVVALYDYQGANPDELSFHEGQSITIVDRGEDGWWKTERDGQILIVPAAYLELASVLEQISSEPAEPLSAIPIDDDASYEQNKETSFTEQDEGSEADSSDDEWRTSSDSESEAEQTDAERQAERRQRELERKRVLEAAGLIVKQPTDAGGQPPVRSRSTRKSAPSRPVPAPLEIAPANQIIPEINEERDLPPLPEPSPRNLDDAFERYQAFKVQEGNAMAQNAPNRLSVISDTSTYASTVPPSSPRQDISTRPPSINTSITTPSSATAQIHAAGEKISSLLHFLGGRSRTPGESGSTEKRSITVSAPIISSPMSGPSPSRENSPAFGSSWSSLVEKEALKEIPPHERKRQEVIFELINTENAYVRDLQLIVGVFYANMLPLLDEKAITVIFANVEDILLTNTAFLSQLEERQKECRLYIDNIGDLLEKHIGKMGCYMQYCVNQSNAIKILQSLRETKEDLATKLQQLRDTEPSVRSLDLSSFLLVPMQRITRYPLLIRQILQYTQHGQDRKQVELALLAAESTLEAINESIREQEGQDRLRELSKRLWVGQGQLDLTAPTRYLGQRRLIKEGLLMKTKSRRRLRAVLCSDILVLVEESTGGIYRMPIPLSDISVHEVTGSRDDLAFTLSTSYPRGGNKVTLRAGTARECQLWMKAIEEAHHKCVEAERVYVRRQSRGSWNL